MQRSKRRVLVTWAIERARRFPTCSMEAEGQDLSRYRDAPDRCNLASWLPDRADDTDDPHSQERRGGAFQSTAGHVVDPTPQQVHRSHKPSENGRATLDGLDEFASRLLPVNVLGVGRMPRRTSDWRSIELGKDVFLHRSAPVDWWNEYAAKAAQGYDPGIMMAKTSLVAYTWTETMQTLEPIGIDRWPYELALKYGIRDALTCCVGQRWLVAYWSRQVLCNSLTHPLRMLLIAAAGFAASRLEQVTGSDPKRFGNQPRITPRELAVLRMVSLGMTSNDIAKRLGIGEETVRSHLKKAQVKLGARNRAHAAAEAIRQQLIP